MEENNVKPANEVSILSEKIETTSMPVTSGISESNVDLTSMSENDNIIKDDTVDSGNNEEDFDTANEEASDSNDILEDSSSDILEDNESDNDQNEEWLDDDLCFDENDDDSGDDMELDAAQVKPKKETEKEKSSLTERLEVAMSSLVNVFPETDLDFLRNKAIEVDGRQNEIYLWIQKVMDKDLAKDFPEKKEDDKEDEIEMKKEGLEFCPFCPFTTTLETKPEEDNIFICMNNDCAKDSCRLCKNLAHHPYSCDAVPEAETQKDGKSGELNSEPTFYTVYPNGEMLSAEDLEFQMVQNHFLKNLPKDSQTEITSVEFVTNPALQQKYEDKKTEFKTNGFPDEEIFAYHGTPPENIKSICKSNLNVIRRTAHGGGYYFSEHPQLSLGYGRGLLMFKLLPGNVYTGNDHNSHVGSEAKFQSKHVPSGSGLAGQIWYGNMRITANNEQFVPYCVIHAASADGKFGKKSTTATGLTAEQRLKQNEPSLGIAPKRALAIETAEQQAAMKKIKEMQSSRGELIKKEQENFKVFNQKVQAKNAAIVAANPEAATSGSVIASDRLMKELRTIHKSRLFKNGDYHVELVSENLYEWHVKLMVVDSESPLAEDLKRLKESRGQDHLLLSFSFKDSFPFAPPFVRVISPCLKGGFITQAGAVCMELLTPQGWLPSYTVETAIIQLSASLVDGKARINFGASPKHTYTLQDAEWSFKRLVGIHEKVGWQKNNDS